VDFGAALSTIRRGGAVRRKSWHSSRRYMQTTDYNKKIIMIYGNGEREHLPLTDEDLLAEDWVILNVKGPPTAPPPKLTIVENEK
jgi:hypothetical protein